MRLRRIMLVISVVVSVLALPTAASGASVTHSWLADGNALDAVGGADGVLFGDATFGVPAHSGQAFVFDGMGDRVAVATDASFYPTGSFTIDAWARTTAASGPGQIMSMYECAGDCTDAETDYEIEIRDGRGFGYVRDADAGAPTNGGQLVTGGPMINDGLLHHVALMRDVENARLVLFVDGGAVVDVALDPGAAGPMAAGNDDTDAFVMGAQIVGGGSGTEEELAGAVDEARIWTGAQSFDTTAPVVTPLVTGSQGQDGWYTGDVHVSWTTQDESVLRSTSGCDATSVTSDTAGVRRTCQATSIGGSGEASVTVKRDATPPAVTCGSQPTLTLGAPGALLNASVSDAGSGPAATSVSAPADTSKPGAGAASVTGRDVAGNATTISCPFTVKEPPRAAPAPVVAKSVAITQIAALPPAKVCVSRRRFPIRLRGVKANKIVRAQVRLNGKQVRNVTGRALGLPIDLRGLPKGKFTVQIVTTNRAGKRLVGKRTYRTCAPKKKQATRRR